MLRLSDNQFRTLLLVGGLLSSLLMVSWFGGNRSLKGEAPHFQLSDFPMVLGNWHGSEATLPDETVKVLGAHAYIQRIYRNESGDEVGLHVAIWINNASVAPAPHHPEQCYPAAGWKIESRQNAMVSSQFHELPVEIIEYKKGPATELTGHWFQVGKIVFNNYGGFQSQRMQLSGLKQWPYTVKVMLFADGQQSERSRRSIKEFATLVDNQLQQLNNAADDHDDSRS